MCEHEDTPEIEATVEQEPMALERRNFIRIMTGSLVGFGLLTPKAALAKAKILKISLDKAPALKELNGSTTLKVKGREILFVRTSEKTIKAFNPECTHKKCNVKYNPEGKRLDCKCHKSSYLMTGEVRKDKSGKPFGPARKPLQVYKSKLKGNAVLVKLPSKA